ncbi:MAG TPA: hypothetical protein VMU27_01685, partial [Candidatus Paceibacterota bacterium]|nr:hypothetical protein [Candidatus Paceibacterota bacterium]
SVSPGTTTTYSLACTGAGGSASQSATVTVTAASAPTVTLSANPGTITEGQSSTLSWSSTNATSCTASNGWSGTEPTSGTQSVSPTATTTYSMVCSGPGGNSATSSATVGVTKAPSGPTVADLDSTNPMNWLIKSVCVNATTNVALSVDPYGGCPVGTNIRKIQIGEGLPYHNFHGYILGQHTQNDSFPLKDLNGNTIVLSTHDQLPVNIFNLYDGSDGYDVYAVEDNEVGVILTADGGGFGQTSSGIGCSSGEPEMFFPASGFLTSGSGSVQTSRRYWEQGGQSFPGTCTGTGSVSAEWQFEPGYTFGATGTPTKTMDAMVSYAGYASTTAFQQHGHIEVFYFTKEYGIARWEVWRPLGQVVNGTTITPASATKSCVVPPTVTHDGQTFVITECVDWSDVRTDSSPALPVVPLPNLNLLAHAHFDDGGGYKSSTDTSLLLWHREGTSPAGHLINWSLFNSTSTPPDPLSPSLMVDALYAGPGVRYLGTNCGSGTDLQCGGTSENIYQDIPISSITSNQTYGYGLQARLKPGSNPAIGTLEVMLQEMDASGNVLWQDAFKATVTPDNGPDQANPSSTDPRQPHSVYLSSGFIYKIVQIPVLSGATKIRFAFSPLTPQGFQILDAWFAPQPATAAPSMSSTATTAFLSGSSALSNLAATLVAAQAIITALFGSH